LSDLPVVVTPDGVERKLGFNPDQRAKPVAFATKIKAIEVPDFPDSEIVPFDLGESNSFQVDILDQSTYGACTGFSIAALIRRAVWQSGYGLFKFSPWYPYSKAANGVDQGAYLDQVVDIVTKSGICEDKYVPYGTIDPRKLTSAANADAANWKIETTVAIPETWKQIRDCVNARWAIYHSLHADSGFNTVNRDGVPQNRRGPHNHAVWSGLGLKRSSRYGDMIKMQNSWSKKWGVNGCAWLTEGNIAGDYGQFIAIVSINVKRDLNPPNVV
jgi:hypothetical protein